MRIGIYSTRLAGTDGVSLETAKWVAVLKRMGHEVFYCAGELDGDGPPGACIEEMHFRHPQAIALGQRSFRYGEQDAELEAEIEAAAEPLHAAMEAFTSRHQLEFLIIQNAHAIPMQLPLAKALADLIESTGLPTIAQHHDFYWERARFSKNRIKRYLDHYFPFDAPNVRHVVIHTGAQKDLSKRRGLNSVVVPNVFDFSKDPPGIDDFNADFRSAIGVGDEQLLILQPTRVVPRKGIELAIDLVAQLERTDAVLAITHEAGDEGLSYLRELESHAGEAGVDLRYVPEVIGTHRDIHEDGHKVYSLWDAYPHADFVTYPSLYEGFGNALIETVYFRRPVLVNRYSVYASDIGPLGFDFVEIDGKVTPEAVQSVQDLLGDPERERVAVEKNFGLAKKHFSYDVLETKLRSLLNSF